MNQARFEEGISKIFIVFTCDDFFEYDEAILSELFLDSAAAFIELFLLRHLVYVIFTRIFPGAGTESWVKKEYCTCYLLFRDILKLEVFFKVDFYSLEPFIFGPLVVTLT